MYTVSGLLSHGDPLWLTSFKWNLILRMRRGFLKNVGKKKKGRFKIFLVIFYPHDIYFSVPVKKTCWIGLTHRWRGHCLLLWAYMTFKEETFSITFLIAVIICSLGAYYAQNTYLNSDILTWVLWGCCYYCHLWVGKLRAVSLSRVTSILARAQIWTTVCHQRPCSFEYVTVHGSSAPFIPSLLTWGKCGLSL